MAATTKSARLERARAMRGICYVPSYARSPEEFFGPLCRRDVVERELAFIPGLGLNSTRVWLSIHGYEHGPDEYVDNLGFMLDTCRELGVDVHLNLFCSVGIDPEDAALPQVPKEKTFNGDALDMTVELGSHTGRATAMVPIPDCGVPLTLFTETWTAGPGYRHVGREEWPRCAGFVRAIADAFRDHPALVILEVMNEPEICLFGREEEVDVAPVQAFYTAMHQVLVDAAPDLPTTIGSTRLENFQQADTDTGMSLDVVSFHQFNDADALRTAFAEANAYAADTGGRPVTCSEWGTYPGETDEAQLALYQQMLPVVLESGAAWQIAHLLTAYCNGSMAALLYPNGTMRPAAVYLRDVMRSL
jgi:hypothetical protein